jgi:hypothetical protein
MRQSSLRSRLAAGKIVFGTQLGDMRALDNALRVGSTRCVPARCRPSDVIEDF